MRKGSILKRAKEEEGILGRRRRKRKNSAHQRETYHAVHGVPSFLAGADALAALTSKGQVGWPGYSCTAVPHGLVGVVSIDPLQVDELWLAAGLGKVQVTFNLEDEAVP
jgi:hypothetical protein